VVSQSSNRPLCDLVEEPVSTGRLAHVPEALSPSSARSGWASTPAGQFRA
jgi:hypothetical protein